MTLSLASALVLFVWSVPLLVIGAIWWRKAARIAAGRRDEHEMDPWMWWLRWDLSTLSVRISALIFFGSGIASVVWATLALGGIVPPLFGGTAVH